VIRQGKYLVWFVVVAAGLLTATKANAQVPGERPADEPTQIRWTTADQAFGLQERTGQPVLFYVSSANCGHCRRMERETLANGNVIRGITQGYIPVRLTAERDADLIRRLGIDGFPTIVVIGQDHRQAGKLTGFRSADRVLDDLRTIESKITSRR